MSYICNICDKTFKYEYLLLRHNKRKTPCKNKNKIVITHENKEKDNKIGNINNNNNINNNINNKVNDKVNDNNKIVNINNNDKNDKNDKKLVIDEKIKLIDEKINRITTESLDDKSTCKFCEKKFKTKAGLKQHIKLSCSEKKKLTKERYILHKEKYTTNDDDIVNITDVTNITDIINKKISIPKNTTLFDIL